MITEQNSKKARIIRVGIAIAVLAVVPKSGTSEDIGTGLRIGPNPQNNTASDMSVVMGQYNHDPGPNTMAIGNGNYLGGQYGGGHGSIAAGASNTFYGVRNYAFGWSNIITAPDVAMAIGHQNYVAGSSSVVIGDRNQTTSTALNALAGGNFTIAYGQNSVSLGELTQAHSRSSVVIGQYNAPVGGDEDAAAKTEWRPTDSLFVIGNGDPENGESNALEVLKDGTVIIPKRQGDISMGSFTAQ